MHWDVVFRNLDYFLLGAWPSGPVGGLLMSVVISFLGIFGAFWIGLVFGLMRLSKRWWVKYPAIVYVEVVRGTPLLLMVFWFYFLAPVLLGRTLPSFDSSLIAFIVFTSAYIAEIVRAGVMALPGGQMEAARGSGLSHVQAMKEVILPQALRNMIPSFVNQFVSLIKDTSLASLIGVNELMLTANQVNNRELTGTMETYIAVAVLYFVVCWVLTSLSRRMESHLSRYQARGRR